MYGLIILLAEEVALAAVTAVTVGPYLYAFHVIAKNPANKQGSE